ncbi:MAG: amino acid adenylation domain-containing protein [Kouleothrix sp.]|jgi:amino acid adenylation domain-containing protein|nr:amino acid adenylation domain-containing protein [Kouleothrix sp.]
MPTTPEQETRRPQLSDARRALLEQRLRAARQQAQQGPTPTITPMPAGEPIPLSFAQRRLWFLDQLAPGSAAYTMPEALRLAGPLDHAALEQALGELVRRHASLRTSFAARGDEAEQIVHPPAPLELPLHDLSGLPAAARAAAAEQLLADEAARPFDLATGPLLRAALLRLDSHEHIFLLTLHHIIGDGWSSGVLLRELAVLYRAARDGQPAALPALPLQYGDYAAWQRSSLQGPALDQQLEYWRGQLDQAPTLLELPSDRPRPPVPSGHGGHSAFSIPAPLAEQLHALARSTGCTPFMLLLTVYGALLARLSGQADLLIGSPVAGRTLPELEPLVGLFLNTLVLRVDLRGAPSFRQALQRVREMALGAYAHQDLPFERLVEALHPERNLSYTPLFQVMFTLQNSPPGQLDLPDLVVSPVGFAFQSAKVDLSLSLEQHGAEIAGVLGYSSDLFDAASAERFTGQFVTLLEHALATPDRPMTELEILPAAELRQILGAWAGDDAAFPAERGIHELFEQQAARSPNATALRSGAEQLSYAELNRRANRLAHALRARGVGPELTVAIAVERSPAMVVAMLGVLKAGGAYVPLDLSYPAARLSLMLEESGAGLLLTTEQLRDRLPPHSCAVATIDPASALFAGQPDTNPTPCGGGDRLAYIVFTSGSTGRPKGVLSTHRGVVNYLCFLAAAYALGPADTVLQLAAFSFDASVRDTLGPLTAGACVVLPPPEAAKEPADLLELIRREHVTCLLSVVPTLLRGLLEVAGDAAPLPARVRLVLLSGEILRLDDCRRARSLFGPQAELVNQYGPTECTMTTTYHRVTDLAGTGAAPVGRPLPNARVYLLDARLAPVPAGVPGEVYIGGPGLARGYLNRPEQTAAAFVESPYGRLYRTGDLARWGAHGTIELLGRRDQQVKIRGQRVELGEIEAVLAQHPLVRQCAVIARDDAGHGQRLVAYLVLAAGEASVLTSELRAHLRLALPDYMLPAVFVGLAALPRTPNGKLDRAALPAPEVTPANRPSAAPGTPDEQRIAAIWAEVLGRPIVGIDDDFFELGGDSFASIRVARLVGGGMRVIDLFAHPTVRALAAALAGDAAPAAQGLLQALTPTAAGAAQLSLICIPYGGGSAGSFQPLARALPPGYALYAVALPGHDLGHDEAPQPIDSVAQTCVDEILARISGPIAVYGHCAGSALAVELVRRLEAAGVPVERLYLGGAFPNPRFPGKLFEYVANDRLAGDRTFETFFRTLGGFTDAMTPDEIRRIVRNLRHDSKAAEDYFTHRLAEPGRARIKAPIVCVVGDKDPLTEYYQERYQEWELFGEAAQLVVLPWAGHYFLKHRASDLAGIIVAARAPAEPAARPAPRAQARPGPAPSLQRFLVIAISQFVSLLGSGLTGFALGVWVYLQTGSVTQFALLSVCALLPSIVVAPLAGALVDRLPRRRVMLLADLGAGLGTLTLALLLWQGDLQLWQIYLVLAWNTICGAFQRPAYTSAIPQLVPKRYLWQANGIVQIGEAAGQMLAPVLAAGLVVTIGLHGVVLIDVVTFLVAVGTLLVVRFPNTLPWRRKEPLLKEIANGWRYITARGGLLALLIHAAATNLLLAIITVLLTPLVLRSLGGTGNLGVVMAAGGAGMLLGGLSVSLWGGPARLMAGLLGFTVLSGLGIALIGVQPALPLVALGFFLFTLTLSLSNGCYTVLIQTKVPHHLHGRVFALNQMIAFSTMPLGYLLAGPLADRVFEPWLANGGWLAPSLGAILGVGAGRGIGLLFIVAGLLTVAVTVAGYFYPQLWHLEHELPDADPEAQLAAEHTPPHARAPEALGAT